jgi:hypothetical protein
MTEGRSKVRSKEVPSFVVKSLVFKQKERMREGGRRRGTRKRL